MATSFLIQENEVTTIALAKRYVPWNTGQESETRSDARRLPTGAT